MDDSRYDKDVESVSPDNATSAALATAIGVSGESRAASASSIDTAHFLPAWLARTCADLGEVRWAVLVLATQNQFQTVGVWPSGNREFAALEPIINAAKDSHKVEIQALAVGYPVTVDTDLRAVVGFELCGNVQPALEKLAWSVLSLKWFLQNQAMASLQASMHRMTMATDLMAAIVEAGRFQDASMLLVTELAQRFDCDRVSLGVWLGNEIDVIAMSNTANPELRGNLVRQIASAMSEVMVAGKAIVVPSTGDDAMFSGDHRTLAEEAKDIAICSVPLLSGAVFFGVLTFERTRGKVFNAEEVERCSLLGALLGPLLEQKLDSERGILRRLVDGVREWTGMLLGPRHLGLKLFTALAFAAALLATFVNGEHRVAAKTVVEGSIQRAAVAPFEGYVAESLVRAGDTVAKGQLLARLDDRDLTLERGKWDAEREQGLRKYRQSLANYDRASMSVIGAQINQAEAQLKLVEEKLARARIVAPFDGVVISGDLSQLLGTPIEQGKVLFEIAPLDAYRVILKVDERDITYLELGQRGELALSGLPSARMPFLVKQITSVSTAEDGHNFFRVEAHVTEAAERLRPGMEGVGKVEIGQRSLIWIWTHSLIDWLRLTLWKWMP